MVIMFAYMKNGFTNAIPNPCALTNMTKPLYVRGSKNVRYHQVGGLGKPKIY